MYPLSGKPDLLSVLCPMILEMKVTKGTSSGQNDIDVSVLAQCFERIYSLQDTNGMFKTIIVLALTGTEVWMMEFSRDIDAFNSRESEGNFDCRLADRNH